MLLVGLVVLAAGVHVTYLASLSLRISAGLPGPGYPVDTLFRDTAFSLGPGCDFFQFYCAGEDVRAGRVFFRAYGTTPPPSRTPYAWNWVRYPPWLAYAIGLPATVLTPTAAYVVWLVLIELAWALSLLLLWRRGGDRTARLTLLALFLLWSPHYVELFMGQTSTIMGTMLLLLTLAAVDGRGRAEAGWLTGSMAFKYQTVWLTAYYLKRHRIWPLLIAIAVTAGLSVPYFVLHPDAFEIFSGWTFHRTNDQIYYQGNFGLSALLAHLIRNYELGPYHLLTAALLLPAAARTLWSRTVDPLRGITLWILAMFLTQVAAYEHHYNLLLPILALGYLRTRSWLYLTALGVLAAPTPFYFCSSSWPGYSPLYYNVGPVAGALTVSFKAVPVLVLYGEHLWRGIEQPQLHPVRGPVGDLTPGC